VAYVYYGSDYVMDYNSTLNTPSSYRAITPDGQYIVYG